MDVYTALYRGVLFPAWERVRHRPTLERLRQLQRTQWCSADEMEAIQLSGLRRLLSHAAATVPAYRRRLAEAGLDPWRLRELADMEKLPLLTRDEVQQRRQEFLSTSRWDRLLTKSTSGSTGAPFRFSYNADAEVWRQAVKLRAYGWAGYAPGKRTVHYWGPPAVPPAPRQRAKIALDRALRREVYIDCARQDMASLRQAVAALRRLRPEVLVGYTQATAELGRFVLREGLREWPAMRVICGAERLLPGDRAVLEAAFGEPGSVYETYGCREFMLLGAECEAHLGLHESMETLLIEIVDERGRAASPGTMGRVVVTDLYNYGMPLVRYVTGDLAIAATGASCPCGRGLRRMASVEGRQQDLLRAPSGRSIPGMLFVALFANLGERVRQFQAVQRRDGHVDLRVVPGPEFDHSVLDGIKTRLSPYLWDVPLDISLVDQIPTLPSGKRQFIVVER